MEFSFLSNSYTVSSKIEPFYKGGKVQVGLFYCSICFQNVQVTDFTPLGHTAMSFFSRVVSPKINEKYISIIIRVVVIVADPLTCT